MLGLMMDTPLLTTECLRYAANAHGDTEIVSRGVDGSIHRYSYSAARQRCLQLSAALQSFGLSQGDRLGSLAWNTHHHFELFYGVTGQGLVLHTINPRLFEETLVKIINHAEDQWIFIDGATLRLAESLAPHLTSVKGWIFMDSGDELPDTSLANVISYEGLLQSQPASHQWPVFDERSASIICYTSGTTGDPKGIVYSHRSIILASLFMSAADMVGVFRPGELEAVMPIAPLFHANGWMMPFTAPMNGQKLVLPGRNFEPSMLCELIAAEGVTACAAVPTVWLGIVQYLKETGFKIPLAARRAGRRHQGAKAAGRRSGGPRNLGRTGVGHDGSRRRGARHACAGLLRTLKGRTAPAQAAARPNGFRYRAADRQRRRCAAAA
jgi:acyl-CoA synthetase (AMP-forming)/AMP-acid ligase II